ncbi:MAG: hypothetical protein UIC65_04085 [Alphaproteobacteria bacterium]|nr:hypothetical protein [Alphaproteobacteria bacterium]
MKPTMMFTVIMITAIVLMVSFGISLGPNTPIALNDAVAPNALFVCPVKDSGWTQIAAGIGQFTRPLVISLFFAIMILAAVWGWALYQNLLKDKFDRGSYKNPWAFTKLLFWAAIIVFMLIKTPDYFRIVHLDGDNGAWVLCDNNTPGARAVHANKVHL